MIKIKLALVALSVLTVTACTSKSEKQSLWIYTSLYKDTISDIQPKLEKQFPDIDFKFYQAGSEEVAAKVQAEALSGKIQADILISSDRFWYEDLARQGKLLAYSPVGTEKVSGSFKHPEAFYTTVSHPVMVLAYNSEVIPSPPKAFKDLAASEWKSKGSSGSPLASGTNFTTVAFLVKKYGWDFFKDLRKNDFIAEGGNSGVVRRLQSKERPVGIVLLENILRLTNDPRIQFILPEDGAVLQSNVLAIVKKDSAADAKQKVADWFFGKDGQEAMVKSFMYAAVPGFTAPVGAPSFDDVQKNAKPWSKEFIAETMGAREKIKEEFSKIVF